MQLSSFYPNILVDWTVKREIAEMPHEIKDAPQMVGYLITTLFSKEEISEKSFKDLAEDGSKRMKLSQGKFKTFFLGFCTKRCTVAKSEQYEYVTRHMSHKVSK